MAYWNTDDFNITPADDGGDELQLVFNSLGTPLWLGQDELSTFHAVYSPNGGMVQIYLKDTAAGKTWHDAPSAARITQVASLLYREGVGHAEYTGSQVYDELKPRTETPLTKGAFGVPGADPEASHPVLAIFVKVSDDTTSSFEKDFRWVKTVPTNQDPPYPNVELASVENFIAAARVNWPDFEERLKELNHNYAHGSRTGDIVIVMNGKQGYLGVTKQDQLNGWHGGPTIAESEVPLMFSMPGPDLLPETRAKLEDAYYEVVPEGWYYRNWQMGEMLLKMLTQFRQKSQ